MSTSIPENQEQLQAEQQKQNDKEYNFEKMRLQLDRERSARQQAEERAAQAERLIQERSRPVPEDDDDNDDEPYVDKKKLKRTLGKVIPQLKEENKNEIQREIHKAIQQEKQSQWLRSNPDFHEVMSHAQKFADRDPELAETILEMPEGFERQKLVYKNIKALGLHKKEEPKQSIQDTVDKNRRNPYYIPAGQGSAPYAGGGDFSAKGQETAFAKMQELKNRLRLG